MKKKIKCTTCSSVIGALEKPEITDADEQLYQRQVTCPNGHTLAVNLDEDVVEEQGE